MSDVILQTRGGEFVHRGKTLPYQSWPEIMLWGERVFTWYENSSEGVPVYREVAMGIVDVQGLQAEHVVVAGGQLGQ